MPLHSIIISRTDNLGDVMLTLPLCGIIKERFPQAKLYFLGKSYTQPLIECCHHIDEFINEADLATTHINADAILFVFPDIKVAKWAIKNKIPIRIGTSHRLLHWQYASRLVHFTRKNSHLHEAQLNARLLKPLGVNKKYTLAELAEHMAFKPAFTTENVHFTCPYILLHPKSKGSAREWPLQNYAQLATALVNIGYQVGITGTLQEGEKIVAEIPDFFTITKAVNLTGKFTLPELIYCISQSQALVACSTGPLHIAAALGVKAIGLYPSIRPMHAGRWAPIGKHTITLSKPESCTLCLHTRTCECINSFNFQDVLNVITTENA